MAGSAQDTGGNPISDKATTGAFDFASSAGSQASASIASVNQAITTSPAFQFTGGWFLFLACGTTVLLSGTQVGAIFVGVLTVGFLFQLEKLLKGQ